ncbi:MAG: hypothetical protein ACMXX6_00025 [Candidatus Woesearchaeota archaeon]
MEDFKKYKSKSNTPFPKKSKEEQLLVDLSSSIKILEDRYLNLRKKTQLTDQVLIDTQRKFTKERKLLFEEITSLKLKLQDLDEQLDNMKNEVNNSVKIKDFLVLDRYLDLWEPINFLTRKEAEKIIEEYKSKE